jgi:uncharacterized membrane protein
MAAFTVWKFDDPAGADRAEEALKFAERDGLVKIVDHAIVTWPAGAEKPEMRHKHEDRKSGAGWGVFWGILIGALFTVPVIGGVAGAALGVWYKKAEDAGITKEQLETIRTEITEGTSALFVATEQGDLDRLGERFHGMHMKLIHTNLTEGERDMLTEAIGGR